MFLVYNISMFLVSNIAQAKGLAPISLAKLDAAIYIGHRSPASSRRLDDGHSRFILTKLVNVLPATRGIPVQMVMIRKPHSPRYVLNEMFYDVKLKLFSHRVVSRKIPPSEHY